MRRHYFFTQNQRSPCPFARKELADLVRDTIADRTIEGFHWIFSSFLLLAVEQIQDLPACRDRRDKIRSSQGIADQSNLILTDHRDWRGGLVGGLNEYLRILTGFRNNNAVPPAHAGCTQNPVIGRNEALLRHERA